ncbi:MAG: sigma-70 family RNA polymerase sigma factor [Chloroflexi bacterium]|nr:sigma-70 family RNA polymerase sigma factor [Chloroflexota bacterium]
MDQPKGDGTTTQLLAEARGGDDGALGLLLVRYRPLLASIVRQMGGHSNGILDADDLRQEAAKAFVELVKEFDSPSPTDFGSYLRQKLKWRLTNYLRRERRKSGRQAPLGKEVLDTLVEEMKPAFDLDINNPRLRAALRSVSPKQRSIIFRLYWQDRSVQEVAAELNLSTQSVTALRRRAEKRIKKMVDPASPP